ncbi:MAG: helix-turn-helix transcriptional regulator [Clostridia bacterium]|mgnify:CR=1 FL=1|nr:helix-turn-helix transcriptional regulator [Clostridia bacterium]
MEEKEFALRLAQLRQNKGVSARDMSLSIGQNPGYINNIESGRALPSLAGFFYICQYLDVTPCDFFDTESNDPTKLRVLLADLKQLNEEQLDTIVALVKELTRK